MPVPPVSRMGAVMVVSIACGIGPGHIGPVSRVYCYDTRRRRNVTGWTSVTWLTERFEEHRPRLRAVAYRMLGSVSEADDAVQEAWLRLSRADTGGVENLGRRG